MPITGPLAHIDISVGHPERSIPFYAALFGALSYRRQNLSMPEWQGPNPTRATWSLPDPDGVRFEVEVRSARPESRDRRYDRYEPGPHHFAFHAASREVVDHVYQSMRAIGAAVLDPPADYSGRPGYAPGYYAAFFADPDGFKLEVVFIPDPLSRVVAGISSARLSQLNRVRWPLRWLLQLPQLFYRADLGWLLGERFLQLTTHGRKSGVARPVVLEVLGRDEGSDGFVIASAWGTRSQWLRNVEASARAEVRVGRRRFSADVVRLSEAAGAEHLRRYARLHTLAYRLFIGPLLLGRETSGDDAEFSELARVVPILAVRPGTGREDRPMREVPVTR